MPRYVDTILIWFRGEFAEKMPEESKLTGGTPHLFVTLLVFLLIINIVGLLPFNYALGSHFLVTGRFALPLWLGTVILNINPSASLTFMKRVFEGRNIPVTMIVMSAEATRYFARPVTLMTRLTINFIIGGIIIHRTTTLGFKIFFPFYSYVLDSEEVNVLEDEDDIYVPPRSFILLYYLISGIFKYFLYVFSNSLLFLLTTLIFGLELGIKILQTFIFTGLLIFYIYEVPCRIKDAKREKMFLKN